LLKTALYSTGALALHGPTIDVAQPSPIIDAHIHLFDTSRPGGVPWPEKSDDVLYRPAMPERYRQVTAGLGIVAAIAVEASPLASDNDWLLGVAAANPIIVGVVGDLVPAEPAFAANLDRLRANPLFLGFRYGNLWNRDLRLDTPKPGFIDGLKLLAHAGLVLESANPDPNLIRALLAIADRVPGLRIVVDHLPHATIPEEKPARDAYWSDLRTLSQNPHVFVKLSEIPIRLAGTLVTDFRSYQAGLDQLWDIFGEDKCLYGSDWPNSDHVATYAQTLDIVRDYISRKGATVMAKFFSKNSVVAYKWRARLPSQSLSR
jgi:predicted TIM-barrel fold metal-dependent hydrolase